MGKAAIPVHRWGPSDARDGLHRLGPCYLGHRNADGCFVLIMPDEKPLPARIDVANNSQGEFEWGYGGAGPAQLALALLVDATNNARLSRRLHQRFKFRVIGHMVDMQSWLIFKDDILSWVIGERRKL